VGRAEAKKAVLKAFDAAHAAGRQVSITLSDSFCVDRYREEFRALVRDKVDILFGNEPRSNRSTRSIRSRRRCGGAPGRPRSRADPQREGLGGHQGRRDHAVPGRAGRQECRHHGRGDLYAAGLPLRLHAAASRWPNARGLAALPRPRSSPMSGPRPETPLKDLM
jgi:sugar/nucleoside kinase (ribokinase family)